MRDPLKAVFFQEGRKERGTEIESFKGSFSHSHKLLSSAEQMQTESSPNDLNAEPEGEKAIKGR